jgi:hypothetical protein
LRPQLSQYGARSSRCGAVHIPAMLRLPKHQPDDPTQSKRFIETPVELKTVEQTEEFELVFKKVATKKDCSDR